MVARLGIVSLIAATASCFGPSLPAIECGLGDVCPNGMICRLPERVCARPGGNLDAAVDGNTTADASPDAPPLPPMIDRGLLTRYFIDEAATGTSPAALADSAPAPLSLPIAYGDNGNLAFTEIAGNRGLRWTTGGGDGSAGVVVSGTKLEVLDGLEQSTYEVVVELTALSPVAFSRILHLGVSGSLGDGSLISSSPDTLSLAFENGSERTDWPVDLLGERLILHVVFDSSQGSGEERLKLYMNGSLVSGVTGSLPIPGGQLSVDNDAEFIVGNSPLVRRSFQGVIHYFAGYTVALDASEVGTNTARLTLSDDR